MLTHLRLDEAEVLGAVDDERGRLPPRHLEGERRRAKVGDGGRRRVKAREGAVDGARGRLPSRHLGRRRAAHVRAARLRRGAVVRRAAKLMLHEEELLRRREKAREVREGKGRWERVRAR